MTRKQIKEQAARYIKCVDWNKEDRCFIGRCPEVFIGAVHGADQAAVYAELCETVEEWIELLGGTTRVAKRRLFKGLGLL